jgi:hypothetical protein
LGSYLALRVVSVVVIIRLPMQKPSIHSGRRVIRGTTRIAKAG